MHWVPKLALRMLTDLFGYIFFLIITGPPLWPLPKAKSLAQARGLFVAGKHTLLGIGHIHPSSGVVLVQLKISGVPGQAFVVRKVTAW